MRTNDEIDALAKAILEGCQRTLRNFEDTASAHLHDAVEEWLASREPSPSPEPEAKPTLPTDRMGWLELWLRCEHALGLDGAVDRVDADDTLFLFGIESPSEPYLKRNEHTRLQSLAAELLASDAKDGGA
jgi:hypothetical protein